MELYAPRNNKNHFDFGITAFEGFDNGNVSFVIALAYASGQRKSGYYSGNKPLGILFSPTRQRGQWSCIRLGTTKITLILASQPSKVIDNDNVSFFIALADASNVINTILYWNLTE